MAIRIVSRGANLKYGRMRIDRRGGKTVLTSPNRIVPGGPNLKRRLNGT